MIPQTFMENRNKNVSENDTNYITSIKEIAAADKAEDPRAMGDV